MGKVYKHKLGLIELYSGVLGIYDLSSRPVQWLRDAAHCLLEALWFPGKVLSMTAIDWLIESLDPFIIPCDYLI